MNNIFGYLCWRGDLSLSQSVFNEVDKEVLFDFDNDGVLTYYNKENNIFYERCLKMPDNYIVKTNAKTSLQNKIDESLLGGFKIQVDDYILDEKRRSVTLTDEGIEKVQKILGVDNLYSTKNTRLVYHLEQAIRAEVIFKRDKDYVVTNSGEVIIVDEHTGRLMQGRRYNEGLHQAIEAKEGVVVKQESMTLATISFQNFFRLYNKLSGMTGTAKTEEDEFFQVYNMRVIAIPTNKPVIREDAVDLLYPGKSGKYNAIVNEIERRHKLGQPILVGTIAIETSELISKLLTKKK